MAEELDSLGSEFVEVKTVLKPQTAARKNPAGGILNTSGRLNLNSEGTEVVDSVATASKLPVTHYWTKFRVNETTRTVAIQTVDGNVPGAVEVRRSPDSKTITLYLHGVFRDFPQLRPDGDSEIKVTLHPSGKAALINLASGGLGVRHTKRDGSDESSAAKQS